MPEARQLATLLDIELDKCVRTYGEAPCTAAVAYAYDSDGGEYQTGALWGDRVADGRELGDFGTGWARVSTPNARVEVDGSGRGYWQDNDTEAHYLQTDFVSQENRHYLFSCYATGTTDTTHPFIFWWSSTTGIYGFGVGWLNNDMVVLIRNGQNWQSTVVANVAQLPPSKTYPVTMVVSQVASSGGGYLYGVEAYITKDDGTILSGAGSLDLGANSYGMVRLIVGSGGANIAHNSWDGSIWRVGVAVRDNANIYSSAERQAWRPETGARRYATKGQCFNTLATCQDEGNYSDESDLYTAKAGYSAARFYGVPGDGGTDGFESATANGADLAQISGYTAAVVRNNDGAFVWENNDTQRQGLAAGNFPLADGERAVIAVRARRAEDTTYPNAITLKGVENGAASGNAKYFWLGYTNTDLSLWAGGPNRGQVFDSAFALYAPNQWLWYIMELHRSGNSLTVRATANDGRGDTGAAGLVVSYTFANWGGDVWVDFGGDSASPLDRSWDDQMEQVCIAKAAFAHSDNALRALTAADIVEKISNDRRTYRFCTQGVRQEGYWANIVSVSDKPAGIKADWEMWQREQVSITLADSVAVDRPLDDPYLASRVIPINTEGGYLARWLTRNRHFLGRKARVRLGWLDAAGAFYAAQTRNLFIRNITRDSASDRVKIELDDGLSLTEEKGAKVPPETPARLLTATTAAATSIAVSHDPFINALGHNGELGHFFNTPAAAGREFAVRVNDELMQVTAIANVSGQTHKLLTVVRGAHGTTAAAHEANDKATGAYAATGRNITDVVKDILTYFAGLRGVGFDEAAFTEERGQFLASLDINGIISEPTGVDKILAELQKAGQFSVWYDSGAGKIRIRSAVNFSVIEGAAQTLTDDDIVRDSFKLKEDPARSVSRVSVFYNPVDPLNAGEDQVQYSAAYIVINQNLERAEARGQAHEYKVPTRWLNEGQAKNLADRVIPQGALTFGVVEFSLPFYPGRRAVGLGENVPLRTAGYRDAAGEKAEYVARVLQVAVADGCYKIRGVRTIYGGEGLRPFIIGESRIGGDFVIL